MLDGMTTLDLDGIGDKIVAWMLVGSDVTNKPVEGWALSSFSTAISIAGAYVAFVILGSARARRPPPTRSPDERERGRRGSPLTPPPSRRSC